MFWELLILVTTTLLVWMHLRKRQILRNLQHVSKVRYDVPILGGCWRFLFNSTEGIFTTLYRICGDRQTPSIFWFGSTLTFLIANPDDLRAVYTSPNCLEKPYIYDFFGGNLGLFNSPVAEWKKDRKAISLTFNTRILQSFVPIFNEKSLTLVNTMRKHIGSYKPFDVADHIFPCTLEMVCSTTLAHDINVQENEGDRLFCKHLDDLSVLVAQRMAFVWLHPDFIYSCTKSYKQFHKHIDYMLNYMTELRIKLLSKYDEQKMKSNALKGDTQIVGDDDQDRSPQHFISEMLKLHYRGEMGLEKLEHQLITMIVGGNETSALTTSNVILMLAMFPDIQERCYEEVMRVCGPVAGQVTYEQVAQLEYLEMVIKETMRLLPVGPFLARQCKADTQLSNCVMPAGSFIILGNYNVQRDKTLWGERANEFDPENFRPDRVEKRHPFSYVPFSGGPRNCVGIKYAWLSVKIMLAAMLREYRFRTDLEYKKLRFKWLVTMKLSGRYMVYLEERSAGGVQT